jgi:hypothetical protein
VALATLIATTAKQPFHGWLRVVFIILVTIAVISFILLLLTGASAVWVASRNRRDRSIAPDSLLPADEPGKAEAAAPSGPAITDRWRPTIDDVSSEMIQLQNNSMSHPGYAARSSMASPPPSVRIGMRIACARLDAAASTSGLRAMYLQFLGQPEVMDLVCELTEIGKGALWSARDDNPPFNFGAVLGQPGSEEAPVAWSRILLPGSTAQRYGRDARCAYLVLYVEPRSVEGSPAAPASLVVWHQRLSRALKLPAALAAFLSGNLTMATSNDPAAEAGVWLKTPSDLRELVDIDGFEVVPGPPLSNWFMGYAIASVEGSEGSEAALAWLRQMCDWALHLDDYESALHVVDVGELDPADSMNHPDRLLDSVTVNAELATKAPRKSTWIKWAISSGLAGLAAGLIVLIITFSSSSGPAVTLKSPAKGADVSRTKVFRVAGTSSHLGNATIWLTDYDGGYSVDDEATIYSNGTWQAFDSNVGNQGQRLPFPMTLRVILADTQCAAKLQEAMNSTGDYLTALPGGCTVAGAVTVNVTTP